MTAQSAAQSYKGLELSVSSVERATNVSLTDCPPGANIVRGVIKPGDPMEFASVKVDFKVTPAFKPGPLPKPVLFGLYGALGGLLGALVLGEVLWRALHPEQARIEPLKLAIAPTITLFPGTHNKVPVNILRGGFEGLVRLEPLNIPEGVRIELKRT